MADTDDELAMRDEYDLLTAAKGTHAVRYKSGVEVSVRIPLMQPEMTKTEEEFEMQDEYDFSNAVQNPYAQRFEELNLISLDPDVKAVFPDSKSVNAALRLLIQTAKDAHDLAKAS